MDSERLDLLFRALGHGSRRRMLDLVMASPGIRVGALASHFELSRIAVLKHVRILERAELLISKKVGRVRHLYFNPVPIQRIYDRWTDRYRAFWASRVVDVKTRVERRARGEESSGA